MGAIDKPWLTAYMACEQEDGDARANSNSRCESIVRLLAQECGDRPHGRIAQDCQALHELAEVSTPADLTSSGFIAEPGLRQGDSILDVCHGHQKCVTGTIKTDKELCGKLCNALQAGNGRTSAGLIELAAIQHQALEPPSLAGKGSVSLANTLYRGIAAFAQSRKDAILACGRALVTRYTGPYTMYNFREHRGNMAKFGVHAELECAAALIVDVLAALPPVLRLVNARALIDVLNKQCLVIAEQHQLASGTSVFDDDFCTGPDSVSAERVLLRAALHVPASFAGCLALPNLSTKVHPLCMLRTLGHVLKRDLWADVDVTRALRTSASWEDTHREASALVLKLTASWGPVNGGFSTANELSLSLDSDGLLQGDASHPAETSERHLGTALIQDADIGELDASGSHAGNAAVVDEVASTDTSRQQRLVAEIRRKYDVDYDGPIRPTTQDGAHKDRILQGLLPKVSTELYAESAHFVFEMIQNSNDCAYDCAALKAAGTEPTLYFQMTPDVLVAHCNERGFSDEDIVNVCSISDSEKLGLEGKVRFPLCELNATSHNAVHSLLIIVSSRLMNVSVGQVGQKGIGFKSVFCISNRAQVHSNGYHIAFDVSMTPLGMIIPTWLHPQERGEYNDQVARLPPEFCATDFGTSIVLPLKLDVKKRYRQMYQQLMGIDDSMLFLRTLQTVILDNQVTGEVKRLTKSQQCTPVELSADNDVVWYKMRTTAHVSKPLPDGPGGSVSTTVRDKHWLVVEQKLSPTLMRIGHHVNNTSLVLAFPCLESNAGHNAHRGGASSQQQFLFAFLPVKKCGLRFVLQADWVTNATREDIMDRDDWNVWLLSRVPRLFCQAHRVISTGKCGVSMAQFVSMVPMVPDVIDMLKPIAREVLHSLQTEAVCGVLTASWPPPDGEQRAAEFEVPAATLRVPPDFYDRVIALMSPGDIVEACKKRVLDPTFESEVRPQVLSELDIECIGDAHVLAVLGVAVRRGNQPRAWYVRMVLLYCDMVGAGTTTLAMAKEKYESLRKLAWLPATGFEGKLVFAEPASSNLFRTSASSMAPTHPSSAGLAHSLRGFRFAKSLLLVDASVPDLHRDENAVRLVAESMPVMP